jgi:hypothetical protein
MAFYFEKLEMAIRKNYVIYILALILDILCYNAPTKHITPMRLSV